MITYKFIDKTYFSQYDLIPMLVHVTSHYQIEKINRGLGGFILNEIPVEPYIKDLSKYAVAKDYNKKFDISNWIFIMAFDGEKAIGGITLALKTKGVDMLSNRDDLAVLWDIRVDDAYKRQGIGQRLFDLSVDWCRSNGLSQIKIECQNNNVPACIFYHKQGAVLSAIDEYAYYDDPECKYETQFVWFINL